MSVLATYWNEFISNLPRIGGLLAGAYFVLRLAIKHGFDAKLENHKNDLNSKLEIMKNEHQQLMFNFEAYNSRKHERYPELYKLVEVAFIDLMDFDDDEENPKIDLENHMDDIKTYCELIEMPPGDTKKVLDLWERNQEQAIKEIDKIKTNIAYKRIEIKWRAAQEYYIFNELYFSEEIADRTQHLLILMHIHWRQLNPVFNNMGVREFRKKTFNDIANHRSEWRRLMKKEVSPVNKGDS